MDACPRRAGTADARRGVPLPLADLAHALVEVELVKAARCGCAARGRALQARAHGCQAGQPACKADTAPLGAQGEGMLDGHGISWR